MVLFQNVGGSVTFLLQIALLAWGIRQLRSVLAKRRETRQRNQGSSAGASPAFASLSPLAALMMAGWTGESGGASGGAGAGGAGSSSAGAGVSAPSLTAAGNGAGGGAGEIGAGRIGAGGEDGGVAEAGGLTPTARAAAVGGAEAGAVLGGDGGGGGGWGGRNAVVVPHAVIDVRARDLSKSQPIPLPSPHVLNIPESDLLQALQLPAAAWEHRFHDTRQPDRRHLLLFLSSHGNSAQRAATVAASLGYTRSCVLAGGLDALKKFLAASAAAGAPAPSPSAGGLGGGGGGGGAGGAGGGAGGAGLAATPSAHSHSSAAAAAAAAAAALGSSSSALSSVPSASAAAAPFHWIPSTAVSVKNISRDAVALLLARKGGQYPHTLILQSRPAPPSAAPLPPLASPPASDHPAAAVASSSAPAAPAAGSAAADSASVQDAGAGVGEGEKHGVREEGGEGRENGVAEGLEARGYPGADEEGRGVDGLGGVGGEGSAGGEGATGAGGGRNRGEEGGGVDGRGGEGREREGEGVEAEGHGRGAAAQEGGGVGRVVWEEVGGGKPWFYLVDVRRFDERVLYGGIPGSVHIPAEVWPVALSLGEEAWKQRYQWPKMEPHSLLILHSNTGTRAYWAAQVARDAGYNRCFVMREGTHGWRLHPSVCVYDDYPEVPAPLLPPFSPALLIPSAHHPSQRSPSLSPPLPLSPSPPPSIPLHGLPVEQGGVPPAPQSFAVEAVDEGMAEQQQQHLRLLPHLSPLLLCLLPSLPSSLPPCMLYLWSRGECHQHRSHLQWKQWMRAWQSSSSDCSALHSDSNECTPFQQSPLHPSTPPPPPSPPSPPSPPPLLPSSTPPCPNNQHTQRITSSYQMSFRTESQLTSQVTPSPGCLFGQRWTMLAQTALLLLPPLLPLPNPPTLVAAAFAAAAVTAAAAAAAAAAVAAVQESVAWPFVAAPAGAGGIAKEGVCARCHHMPGGRVER
ncbi:unnamed protein product [Closterium sp. Naga37s-1]|nr:unnamed protein product [Closterium sp. Naga37s-1]